jgi:DHA2 family multidrug resistance protein
MSSAPIAAPQLPLSSKLAALAGALPSTVSPSRLLGIFGVMLGAGIVTLAGRLLSLGLADLKGNVGIGFDEGAWISSAFNVPLMFIAPFVIYFGAFLGARRILLVSAGIFTVVSIYLPLVHSYGLMIVLLVIAGLSSGTFYPLALTFALRNIPLRYLPYTVGLYATCIEGAVNFGMPLYGWYREHASWHWMFWTAAVLTPVMIVCVYFGVPQTPVPARSGESPSFVGFLYASLGFSMFFAAMDQGQRLDWWRSGLFIALFVGGLFFMLFALIRRLRAPNPFVDLPYLRKWNTQLLAAGLFAFRFVLLATIIVVPQGLSVRGFDAGEIGPAVLWTAIPQLFMAFVAGYFLLEGLSPRLLMAIGFACIGFACCLNAEYTTVWSAANFYRSELLMAVGQSFAFMGLVSSLLLQAIFSGALEKPQLVLTFSTFIHIIRLFGGQIGVATMGRFIAEREKLHSNLLGLHVQKGYWIASENLHGLTSAFAAKSNGLAEASGRAAGVIGGQLRLEAFGLSIIDAFHLIAWVCVAALLLIAMLLRPPLNFKELSLLQSPAQPIHGAKS